MTDETPKTEIQATVGRKFTLSVPCKGTSGYSWEAIFNAAEIETVGERSQANRTKSFGSGAKLSLEFKPIVTGDHNLTLVCKRPWEQNELERREYLVHAL
jgi:predicted secreted protein